MNSTNMPANLLTQRLNVEEQLQGGWHYSAAQYYNTVMVQPHADQMPYQICCTDYLQSVPNWLPYWGLHHYGHFMSQGFHNSQGMVYHPAHPYYGYQTSVETSYPVDDPASFHYRTFPQPNFVPEKGIDDVSMVTSFVEVPPLAVNHTGGLDLANNLYTSEQVPAHLTNHDLQSFSDGVPMLPEVTSLKDIPEINQPHVEPEFGDAFADTGSMRFHPLAIEDHSSEHVYLEACTEHFPERAEFSYGPVYATEAASTMDFFYAMDNYGELSLANPDFQDCNKVTPLNDNIRFFSCEPVIYQPPVQLEIDEASVDSRSMGFHPWATQDHSSDSVYIVANGVNFSDGLVLTTEAASTYYHQPWLANPEFQDTNKWSDSVDPTFPEVIYIENDIKLLQAPVEPEFGAESAKTGSMRFHPLATEDHSSDHVNLLDCTEHFQEQAEFCNGLVSTTEAAPTHYDQPWLANPDFQDPNKWSTDSVDPKFPQVTSLEDAITFFQCEPEAEISEIYQPLAEPEIEEASSGTESVRFHPLATQEHSSVAVERAEFGDGPVSTTEAVPSHNDQLCHAKPDFKTLNNWSDSVDPTCPEVTSLENTTEFFQHEPEISEIYLPPPEAEFGEASADTGSLRVHPIMIQDHSSDHVGQVDCTKQFQEQAEFCHGPDSTTEAAPTDYNQPCHAKPDFQDPNYRLDPVDPTYHEVTSLEDTTEFFQCEPETKLSGISVKPESGEASADTGSMRVQPYQAKTDFNNLNNWSDSVDSTCPEVTSLENTTEFLQHEPEISEMYLPPPEAEFGEASTDTGSMRVHPTMIQDHSSDHVDLVDCTEHFPERVEFCDGPVSTTETAPTHYDPPCHAKPDFQDNNSVSVDPTYPEVTSLEDSMSLFECDPEIPQPPVEESELGEANAGTESLRVSPTETQDYPLDLVALETCILFCDSRAVL